MKLTTKIATVTLMTAFAAPVVASAAPDIGLSRAELGQLRLQPETDRNGDGDVSAEEVLRTVPEAFDLNADGRIDARERGIALMRLESRRLN